MELSLNEMMNESDMIQGGVIPTKKVVEKQRKQTEMIKRIKAHHQQQTNQQENLDLDDVVSMLSSIGFGPTLRKRSTKQPSVKVDDTKQSNREKKTTSKLVSKSSKTVKSTSTAKSTSTTTKTKISKVFAKPMIKEIKDRLISLYHPELVPYFKQKLMKYDGFVDNNLADMNVVDFLMEKYAKDLIEPVLKKAIKGLTKIQVEGMYDDSTLVTYSGFELNRPEERNIDKLIEAFKLKLDSNNKRNKRERITQKQHILSRMDVNQIGEMLSRM